MYAAHFAAGLAIKSRTPLAPTAALLAGAFLPDFLWIAFATAGIEPTRPGAFFDDWSHSLVSCLVWATLFAALFLRLGRTVAAAMWLAVFSHFLLDLPIHPRDLALYPHSAVHLGWGLWRIGPLNYWLAQLGVLLVLMLVYSQGARRQGFPARRIGATCAYLLAFHLLSLPAA
ncbi:MAG: hypothetical protein M3O15_13830 [Acidobacteriota bacterium]|nr:hypothetical protein [Acidobacteriota bacterium]